MTKRMGIVKVGAMPKAEFSGMLEVEPGTQAKDIIDLVRMPGFAVINPDTGAQFAEDEYVYAALEDGGKLLLVPGMQVGEGEGVTPSPFAALFARVVYRRYEGSGPRMSGLNGPEPAAPVRRVTPSLLPYWQQQGWKKTSLDTYEGHYVTVDGRWKGKIVFDSAFRQALIEKPPHIPRTYTHWLCLMSCNDGTWRRLHFTQDPVSVDGAILAMQQYLTEALQTEAK